MKALEKKKGEYLHGREIHLVAIKEVPSSLPKSNVKSLHLIEDYFRRGSLLMEEDEAVEGLDGTPQFLESFSLWTCANTHGCFIQGVLNVGEVVSVRLIVNHECKHVGYGFVEFASANEAKKALEKKNGEYLQDHKIFLYVPKKDSYPPRAKYNLVEKLCYEEYLRRQNLVIEEDETVEETPDFLEAVAVREKSLFVSHLSSEAEISDIIHFFKDVGEVVHVRLIVDNIGKHVGDGFVEFASVNEAKKALEKKNGEYLLDHQIFLDVAKKAPYPPQPKYEDYLRQENLLIEEDEAVEGLYEIPDFVEEVAAREKTIFVDYIPYETKILNIVEFFKSAGQVVRLRLIVDHMGERVGCGFVEFASANEAKKALEKKNGFEFSLDVVERAPYPLRPKYSLAEKLW
ncbi:unnamed protein product [Arabis nemorensis]|uniref:RRM domain-containing protein n=1 Tax=Arabis nemorensis TaxID=586526 RepID=A0A565BYD7_9BRAS|nr:unnamed protein product [Arabis nemorensis]